jgi:uncharacterized protein YcaQ
MKKEDLIARAKELVLSGVVKGYSSQILEEAAESDPELFEGLLLEIGDQAIKDDTLKTLYRIYGEELTGIAISLKHDEMMKTKTEIKEIVHRALKQL